MAGPGGESPEEGPADAQPAVGRFRPRKAVAAVAVAGVLVAATTSVWFIASRARTPAQRAADAAAPPTSVITAEVEAGPLVDALTLEGVIRRNVHTTIAGVAATNSSKSVVTDVRVTAGAQVISGQAVAAVSGRPVIALVGRFPAYRDLAQGDRGPDVNQLQAALGVAATGVYDAATARAVAALYRTAGYSVPGAAIGGGAPSTVKPSASGAPAGQSTPQGGLLPIGEVAFVPSLPATVVTVSASVGGDGTKPLMTVSSGDWQVQATVTEEQRTQLRDLPEGAVATLVGGRLDRGAATLVGVRATADAQQPADGSGVGAATNDRGARYEAVFALKVAPDPGAAGRGQRVTVELRRSSEEVVVVPLSALWTRGADRTEVTVVGPGRRTPVQVRVELSANGRAAVRPVNGDLPVGATVLVGSERGRVGQ